MQKPAPPKDHHKSRWPLIALAVTAAAIVLGVFLVLRTMPPRVVVMATGAEGGAYYEIGKRYQEILARSGVQLRLVQTGGAVENLALLRDRNSGVSVALLQGGTVGDEAAAGLESLGTVFYEPLWLFMRSEFRGVGLDAMRGRKISIGPEGSGTRTVALELLKRYGMEGQAQFLALTPQQAADKLLAGDIDAAILLLSWDSPVIQKLLADDRVEATSFPYAEAYVALYPYLTKVMVPAGVVDLAKRRPPADVTLLAPKASLAVRQDIHSAIQYLLLTAAVQVHSGSGIFQRAGQFPAAEAVDIPLSAEALQFYKSGRPFLQNYLPFWAASLVGRLLLVAVPILGLLYPLMRFLPALYGWLMRSKISRLYGELRFLEDQIGSGATGARREDIVARLDGLEQQANHLRVPAGFASMQYMLRNHIDLVRARLHVQG